MKRLNSSAGARAGGVLQRVSGGLVLAAGTTALLVADSGGTWRGDVDRLVPNPLGGGSRPDVVARGGVVLGGHRLVLSRHELRV